MFDVVQGLLLGLGGLLLSFHPSAEVIIAVIGHMHRYSPVRTELTVAEEVYPPTSPSLSDHWNKLFNSSGDITLVEEDGSL